MFRLSKNSIGAIGIAAGTMVYLAEAWKLPFGSIRHPDLGFMPILAGVSLLGLCLLMLAREGLRNPSPVEKEVDLFEEKDETRDESGGFRKPFLLSLALFLYPLAFVYLGYLIATALLTAVSLRVLEYRAWLGSFLLALIITFASFFLFAYGLEVQLPRGIF